MSWRPSLVLVRGVTFVRAILAAGPIAVGGCTLAVQSDDLTSGGTPPEHICQSMVKIPNSASGTFCIDADEVTVASYTAFYQAMQVKFDTTLLHPACTSRTSADAFMPALPGWTGWDPARPIASIDWCAAWAYCLWSGKRLCGGPSGLAAPVGEGSASSQSLWYTACAGVAQREYPYGAAYVEGTCNVSQPAGCVANVVGANACEGGYKGLYNMSGNVAEWEDACDSEDPTATCLLRGGSCRSTPTGSTCAASLAHARNDNTDILVGFRCCASPIP